MFIPIIVDGFLRCFNSMEGVRGGATIYRALFNKVTLLTVVKASIREIIVKNLLCNGFRGAIVNDNRVRKRGINVYLH